MQIAVLANQTLADVGRSCAPRARRKNVPKLAILHKLKSIFELLSYRRLCDSAHFNAFWQHLMQRQVVCIEALSRSTVLFKATSTALPRVALALDGPIGSDLELSRSGGQRARLASDMGRCCWKLKNGLDIGASW